MWPLSVFSEEVVGGGFERGESDHFESRDSNVCRNWEIEIWVWGMGLRGHSSLTQRGMKEWWKEVTIGNNWSVAIKSKTGGATTPFSIRS